MSKILKIKEINNFSIFQNFDWDTHLRHSNQQNQTYDFKDINIFYGRNYSGKTSLSKIIRALETGIVSPKYENPNFKIELKNGETSSVITQSNLSAFNHPIHVYNSDFVKENLKFIHDENANIESFSVTLGGANQQILDRIQELKGELGLNEENIKSGVFLDIQNKDNELKNAQTNYQTKFQNLEKILGDKATRNSDSIKNQFSLFGEINYTITRLRQDITTTQNTAFHILTDNQIIEKKALIEQKELANPPEIPIYTLNYPSLINSTSNILKTVVGGSQKIEELVKNSTLNAWVETGHPLHLNRSTCAFCNSEISDKRRKELAQHFDQETRNFQDRLVKGIEHLTNLIDGENFKINLDISHYYQQYHAELSPLKTELIKALEKQKTSLEQLRALLENKNRYLFTSVETDYPYDHAEEITNVIKKIEAIRTQCIQQNDLLVNQQKEAKNALRLNHIYHFLQDINYTKQNFDINLTFLAIAPLETELTTLNTRKGTILSDIQIEEARLKSEGEACRRINEILQHDFGHQHLSLEPIENASTNGQSIKFEIQRLKNGIKIKAHNLSEGECSLISFCYFLAKIQDDLDQDKNPIIWIDDPICSLDSNHIFFIYSLINEKICGLKKFSQLFISTHNLDFLKYLKRLNNSFNNNGVTPNLKVAKFLIQRFEKNAIISQMPNYLSEYATEFNYLFNQIHTCASTNILSDDNHSFFYNFSNNARKFIEIYSFYKFPTYFREDDERLKGFWNDEIHRLFIGRVNNEYSHCAGVLERGMSLVDVPEMHRVAKAIIQKVKEDTQQYTALLESINIDITNDPLSATQSTVA